MRGETEFFHCDKRDVKVMYECYDSIAISLFCFSVLLRSVLFCSDVTMNLSLVCMILPEPGYSHGQAMMTGMRAF